MGDDRGHTFPKIPRINCQERDRRGCSNGSDPKRVVHSADLRGGPYGYRAERLVFSVDGLIAPL